MLDSNGTVNQEKETKSMLDWLQKSFSPSLAVVLRSGDMLVLYPHHTKTAPLTDIDRHSLVNLGLVYADNHPIMQLKKFRCSNTSVSTDASLGIVEASTFNTHSGSFMVSHCRYNDNYPHCRFVNCFDFKIGVTSCIPARGSDSFMT